MNFPPKVVKQNFMMLSSIIDMILAKQIILLILGTEYFSICFINKVITMLIGWKKKARKALNCRINNCNPE